MEQFTNLIEQLIADKTWVTIGSGDSELRGSVIAFDREHHVVTYESGNTKHYIPLTSIRSIGAEGGGTELSVYLELFRR